MEITFCHTDYDYKNRHHLIKRFEKKAARYKRLFQKWMNEKVNQINRTAVPAEHYKGVKILDVYLGGSVLTNKFNSSSDIDIFVLYEGDIHPNAVALTLIGRVQIESTGYYGKYYDVIAVSEEWGNVNNIIKGLV